MERKISEVNTRAESIDRQFKMAAGDMVSIRGQVMKYMYIPTRIKREF